MEDFSWHCPYCNKTATITTSNFSSGIHYTNKDSKDNRIGIKTSVTICPNSECRDYTIQAELFLTSWKVDSQSWKITGEPIAKWPLKPQSEAKQMPDYVPQAIISDYEEACLIKNLSPKASATLSRRCLQGMIRDFFDVKGRTLFEEISAIKEKVDPDTWEAIDAIRSIGNIGAHMEKDINLIIEVESSEAGLLISLIESLIKDWYITRYERKQRLESIVKIAEKKREERSQ